MRVRLDLRFMQVPGGWFVDRLGSRHAYGISLFLWSSFTMLMGIGRSFASLFGLRLAIGFAEAPAFPTNNRAVAAWFPRQERAMATGVYTAGEFVGRAFLTPVLFWLLASYGWRSIFYTSTIFGEEVGLAESAGSGRTLAWAHLAELFEHRQLLGIHLGQFCIASTIYFFPTWFPAYLISEKHMPILRVGFYAAVPYIAAVVGVLTGGVWSDAMLRRGRSLTTARKVPVIAGLAASTTILAAKYTGSPDLVIAIMSLAFFGQGMSAIAWTIVEDVAPRDSMGLAGGVLNFCANLAGIVTPLVIGFIVQATRSFAGP